MQSIKLELKNLDELIPADYNPRKDLQPGDAEYESLKKSINQFGYVEPIIWNKVTGHVVGGHQRLKILKDLGEIQAECVIVELNEAEEKGLNIALNKISGEWDIEKLNKVIEDLQAVNFDMDLTGFSQTELDKMLSEALKDTASEDDFDIEQALTEPLISQAGDIWLLGRHRVICGDATMPETYDKLMGDFKANLLLTDPPYFVNLENESGRIANDDLKDSAALSFLMNAFNCFKNALAADASAYVFYASSKSRIFYDAFEDAGFKVSCCLVWKKDKFTLSRSDYKHIFEPIIFGWKQDGRHRWYGDQKQATCFEFPSIKNSKTEGFGHPSSKPVALLAYLIQQSTMTNNIVLDGFLGSASALIACEQLNRICYGIELEPKFVDVAVKRYINFKQGNCDDVCVFRNGEQIAYKDLLVGE
ncbi:MAG: DNA modification methylase [Synergistaceae bacterium]|nr:DNA modification methylase [Synergistaceae bacterium]